MLAAGAALVLPDVIRRCLGDGWGLAAIVAGMVLTAFIARQSLVLTFGTAFLLSEAADFAVYTPLQRRRLVLAVALSSTAGLVVDSVVFLSLAFGSLDLLAGQVVGKAWAVLFSLPLSRLLRPGRTDAGVKVVNFDFALPPDRIAQSPARLRDAVAAAGRWRNSARPDRLRPAVPAAARMAVLVANDARVIPAQREARLQARRASASPWISHDPMAPGTPSPATPAACAQRGPPDLRPLDAGLEAEIVSVEGDGAGPGSHQRAVRPGGRWRLAAVHRPRPHGPTEAGRRRLPDHVRRAGRWRGGGADRRACTSRPALLTALVGGARHPSG